MLKPAEYRGYVLWFVVFSELTEYILFVVVVESVCHSGVCGMNVVRISLCLTLGLCVFVCGTYLGRDNPSLGSRPGSAKYCFRASSFASNAL